MRFQGDLPPDSEIAISEHVYGGLAVRLTPDRGILTA